MLVCVAYNYDVYRLSPDLAISLLGDPYAFCEQKERTCDLEDYTYAKIADNGDTVLILSKKQAKKWKETGIDLELLDIVQNHRTEEELGLTNTDLFQTLATKADIDISEDYSEIYIRNEEGSAIVFFLTRICEKIQLLDLKKDTVTVTWYFINDRGEVIESVTWPRAEEFVLPSFQ